MKPKYPSDPEDYYRMAMDPRMMHVDVVELQRQDLRLVREIDASILRRTEFQQHMMPELQGRMVVEMRHFIYGKPHPERHVIRFPSDWWQAAKERFAPAWFRDRWPVKFTEIKATLNECYPDIEPVLPEKNPVMRFQVLRHEVANYDW